ncbi:solute carrier family 22 member 20-like [Gastrophryne carolinensis]
MAFNDLLQTVGSFGRFQLLYVVLLFFPLTFMGCNMILQNFTAVIPSHRCRIPELDDGLVTFNVSVMEEFVAVNTSLTNSSCTRIKYSEFGNWTKFTTEMCEDGWVYDRSVFASTIVTEWDLVCNLRTMKQVAQSIYMAGVLVGAMLLGTLSDRFGRKIILTGSHLLMAVSGTLAAFLPSFVAYCVFRFLCGIALSGIVLNTNVLVLEWTSPKRRTLLGPLFSVSFISGEILLAGLAYLNKDWRWLQFTVSAPGFLFFLTTLFVPESARWLLLKGRSAQALRDLRRVAWINGKKEDADKLTEEAIITHMQSDVNGVKQSYSFLDLFRTPAMRRITITIMLVWLCLNLGFYGLSMDLESIKMNIFLTQLMYGCIGVLAHIIVVLSLIYVGRRRTQSASLILAGVTLLCNAFLSQDLQIVRFVLAVFGKGFLTVSYCCAYLYTAELFPTVIRQSGMGVSSMIGRIGAMGAPLVLLLSEISYRLPLSFFGVDKERKLLSSPSVIPFTKAKLMYLKST